MVALLIDERVLQAEILLVFVQVVMTANALQDLFTNILVLAKQHERSRSRELKVKVKRVPYMDSEVECALGLRIDVVDDQLPLVRVMAHQIDGLLAEQVVDVTRCLDLAKERHMPLRCYYSRGTGALTEGD